MLGEYIDHHVKEEEGEMFPKARKAVDTAALGIDLQDRKDELTADFDDGGEEAAIDNAPVAEQYVV